MAEQREGLIALIDMKWSTDLKLLVGDEIHSRLMEINNRQLVNLINHRRIGWGVIRRSYVEVMAEGQRANVVAPDIRLPQKFLLPDGTEITRGALVLGALQAGGLTAEAWMNLPADEREELVWARLDAMKAEIVLDKKAQELNEQELALIESEGPGRVMTPEEDAALVAELTESETSPAPDEPAEPTVFRYDPARHTLETKSGWWYVMEKGERIEGPMRRRELDKLIGE